MSMISEQVKRLRKLANQWKHNDVAGFNLIFDACDTIEALSAKVRAADRPTEWIPCSERMPDAEYGEGDSVLCCTETGLMYILYWDGGNWCVPTGEPHIWVNHKTGWHDRVIAWMPLPEPYREDSE